MTPATFVLLGLGAYYDEKTGEIPNWLTYGSIILGILACLVFGGFLISVGTSIFVFFIGLWLWDRNVLGGGDVKLLTGLSILYPFVNVFPTSLVILVMSGITAMVEAKFFPKKNVKMGTHFLLNYLLVFSFLVIGQVMKF